MELQKDLIITLENKDYFVVNTALYENNIYAYLLNLKEDDYMYVKYIKETSNVEIIEDNELIKKIAPELIKNID